MAAFSAIRGYPLQVWTQVQATLTYAAANLPNLTGQAALGLATLVAQTLRNARDSIDTYEYTLAAGAGFTALAPAIAAGEAIDPTTFAYCDNRVNAIRTLAEGLALLQVPIPGSASTALAAGQPAIPYPGLIEFLANFTGEPMPTGLTAATFQADAQASATAWATLAAAIASEVSGTVLNQMSYMQGVSQDVATSSSNVTVTSPAEFILNTWNQMVAVPAMLRFCDAAIADPTSQAAQQLAIMRTVIAKGLNLAWLLVVNLEQQIPAQVATAVVLNNDNLMSFAARNLGDYTQWQAIAQLNGLLPPYITQFGTPGSVAAWGARLYLPTAGAATQTSPPASYLYSFLGTDIYYGPMNQDMLPWTGDLNVQSGYQNLAFALGRRLQTTLGTLIYHSDYGSRIPPEVGNITTQDTAQHIGAYAESAIQSDVRVQTVLSVTVTVLTSWAINVNAVALPKGSSGGLTTPISSTVTTMPGMLIDHNTIGGFIIGVSPIGGASIGGD